MNTKTIIRYHYADIMKGIGIILVLMGHIQRIAGLGNWIYSFHMPLFFFVSGMFFHDNGLFFKKKVKSLLVPYLSFALILFLYWWLLEVRFRPPKEGIDALTQFGNIFFPMNVSSQEPYYFDVVLWFLPCLFMVELIFWCINHFLKRKPILFATTISLIIAVYFICGKPWFPLWTPQAITALPFYFVGYIVFQRLLVGKPLLSKSNYPKILIGVGVLLISALFISGRSDMRSMLFWPNYFSFVLIALLLSFSTLLLSIGINKNRILEWLGKNSLVLMLIHDPIKRILIFAYAHLFGLSTDAVRGSLVHVLILTVLLILICIPITIMINRYGYFLLGKNGNSLKANR